MNISFDYNDVAIIGGGCSGASVAIQQMWGLSGVSDMASASPINGLPTRIRIFEPSGVVGRGLPYKFEEGRAFPFLLNQPASDMSPFASKPGHFSDWIQARDSKYTPDSFVPRALYGQYLAEVFKDAHELVESKGHKVEIIPSSVSSIRRDRDNLKITTLDGAVHSAGVAVVAVGHARTGYLSELRGQKNFFEMPENANEGLGFAEKGKGDVLLVGTSQTMLDALSILDSQHYAGRIIAASRNTVLPWIYDPAEYKDPSKRYSLQLITPDLFRAKPSLDEFKEVLVQEISAAQKKGYAIGYVLTAFRAQDMAEGLDEDSLISMRTCADYIRKLYGNPTPPERHEMMCKYLDSDQMKVLQSDISASKISPVKDGFKVSLDGGGVLKVSAIFNCATNQMSILGQKGANIGLLDSLYNQRALYINENDPNSFEPGRQRWDNLFMVGPCTNSQRWGVGTFNKGYEQVARESLERVSGKNGYLLKHVLGLRA